MGRGAASTPIPAEQFTPRSPTEPAVEAFVEHLRRVGRRRDGTVRAYGTDLIQYSRFLHVWVRDGAPSLSHVGDESVDAFAVHLGERGMRPATVRRKVAAVRAFGRYLAGLGLVRRAPQAREADAPVPDDAAAAAPLSPQRVAAVLARVSGAGMVETRDRALLEVLYGSGLRLAELEALNLSSVQLERAAVRVVSPVGVERDVPLTPQAVAALERYLPRRAESLLDRAVGDLEAGALFVGVRGRRLHRRSIQRAVVRYLDEAARSEERDQAEESDQAEGSAQAGGGGPRSLRRAFAEHLLAAGADASSVRALLGQEAMPGQGRPEADVEALRRRYAKAHPRA